MNKLHPIFLSFDFFKRKGSTATLTNFGFTSKKKETLNNVGHPDPAIIN